MEPALKDENKNRDFSPITSNSLFAKIYEVASYLKHIATERFQQF